MGVNNIVTTLGTISSAVFGITFPNGITLFRKRCATSSLPQAKAMPGRYASQTWLTRSCGQLTSS